MSKAQQYLKEVFGEEPYEEKPVGIRGILHTNDYHHFTIVDDLGNEIQQFTGAKLANKCLPGDHVHWSEGKCLLDLRAGYPPIVGTVALTSKTRYGLTARGIPIYLFVPYDKSYPNFVVGCSEKDLSRNIIAIAKFDDWKENAMFPRANLQQVLGRSGEYEAEYQALIWQASPLTWPKGPYEIQQREKCSRNTITGYTFNIDPPGCKDIDDVFTFEKLPNGNWKVIVTISDVASFVENGSVEDIFASVIGQTLYDKEGRVLRPMLPVEYSEGVCSLLPGKESYGISLSAEWSGKELSNMEWMESRITNQRSYSYEDCQELDMEYREVLGSIASYLAKETVTDSHQWVEQMMIWYNKEAGKILKECGMGIVRRHSAPERERWETYRKNVPELEKLAYTSAEYCLAEETETYHFGLDTDQYAHASSPIRRYADLVNQRILKIHIRQSKERFIVPQAMIEMNKREKVIRRFARDIDFLEAIREDRPLSVKGIIVECISLEETKEMKIRIYVPLWRRMISAIYKKVDEHTVWSRDETRQMDVTEFREVELSYAFHKQVANWKDRLILQIQ